MSIDTDYEVLRKVLEREHPTGWAIEFGVYSGYSLNIIAEHMPVIGLDSFEGLPEYWREGFPEGTFSLTEAEYGVIQPRPLNSLIMPGLFEDILPMLQQGGIPPIGLVHIDCDLYSSTVTALDGVKDAINVGTIIVFDEFHGYEGWQKHEALAWLEFHEKYDLSFERIYEGEQEAAYKITGLGRLA